MQFDITAFLLAAGTVVLAEMGDKTQLLAMAFAAKYKPVKVLIGVLIATVVNHGLAVWVGSLIMQLSAARVWIDAAASISFIFFGLWTIKGDKLAGEDKKKTKYGAIVTVAVAFFIAEMGDKTQLATIALSTKFPLSPLSVLAGTTVGMIIADGIGIIIGVVLCKRIPEKSIKTFSAIVFILFGLYGSFESVYADFKAGLVPSILITVLLAAASLIIGLKLYKKYENEENAPACAKERP